MSLELDPEEKRALAAELRRLIADDRHPRSRRIRTLQGILDKLVPPRVRELLPPLSDSLAETLLREGLPPPNTRRWVVRRKAAVVVAVSSGEIAVEEACQIYQLTEEELLSRKDAFETHGLAGLRTTRIQQYRRGRSRRIPLPRR